jgi:hypothetical protein
MKDHTPYFRGMTDEDLNCLVAWLPHWNKAIVLNGGVYPSSQIEVMTVMGQSRQSNVPPVTSGLPSKADLVTAGRHVSQVPTTEMARQINQRKSRPKAAQT